MSVLDRPLISLNAKVYVGTAGTTVSPGTNTLLGTVGDVEVETKKAEAKTPRRGCGFMLVSGTLIEMSVKFTVVANPADTLAESLITAYFNSTPLAFLILDNTSGEGPDADFEIMDFKRSEKLEDAIAWDFTIKPTWGGGAIGRSPSWHAASYG
jgi:hypothetical protein